MRMTRTQAITFLLNNPAGYAKLVGFDKLTELHNGWIKDMITGKKDATLQAHRLSYKTTCVSLSLALSVILLPKHKLMFLRKTDNDVKEVIRQVQNILQNPRTNQFVRAIYGTDLKLPVQSVTEITTNLSLDVRGTSQLVGMGIGSSLTGKHFDRIYTDDVVNLKDRQSKAERDRTKMVYQELQNIKNRGGRIYNTGTPWHKDDAFTLMPEPRKYDCYSTGIIPEEELDELRSRMLPSLFAANYELKHIASEDVIFTTPNTGESPAMAEQGVCHIDAAYGGEDYTAFTIVKKREGKYYVFGKLWHRHIDECLDEIIELRQSFRAGRISCENNADKGYLRKELVRRGERVNGYHESMNKYFKITSYLKFAWQDIYFVLGTDNAYIDQICDYNEHAEHDDAPDSLASLIRELYGKADRERTLLWV